MGLETLTVRAFPDTPRLREVPVWLVELGFSPPASPFVIFDDNPRSTPFSCDEWGCRRASPFFCAVKLLHENGTVD